MVHGQGKPGPLRLTVQNHVLLGLQDASRATLQGTSASAPAAVSVSPARLARLAIQFCSAGQKRGPVHT